MAFDISELSTMDATAQGELVRRRELTPLELVDAAIARIEHVNPTLNAVITPLSPGGAKTGFLFESNRHTHYSTRTVQSIVTNCARAAGIQKRVYPHLLRHSIATILLDCGLVPIDQVQEFLGHLNLSTTQIYAETSSGPRGQLGPGDGREAVAAGHTFHARRGRNFDLR